MNLKDYQEEFNNLANVNTVEVPSWTKQHLKDIGLAAKYPMKLKLFIKWSKKHLKDTNSGYKNIWEVPYFMQIGLFIGFCDYMKYKVRASVTTDLYELINDTFDTL